MIPSPWPRRNYALATTIVLTVLFALSFIPPFTFFVLLFAIVDLILHFAADFGLTEAIVGGLATALSAIGVFGSSVSSHVGAEV
jgi:hypothetical protein